VAARKTERLLNLVIALLSTRRYLPWERIRQVVPGYDDADDEAARRKFERDKAELRELGIPLETGSNSVFDDDVGYRIAQRDYELPEISLEPDEAQAVGLAARLWAQAGLAEDASRALLKLRAAGIDVEGPQLPGLEPRVEASDAAFEPLVDAVTRRRPVTFLYRSAMATEPVRRTVEPWRVFSWHGHWYVVGHDLDADARRVFRLSRVVAEVRELPGEVDVPDVDVAAVVRGMLERAPERTARVRIRRGSAFELRRRASATVAEGDWVEADVVFRDVEDFADEVAGYGRSVVVLAPPDARAAVLRRLRALAGAAR
jgi:proteasome accessory factor B